jgi:hypothetical protein
VTSDKDRAFAAVEAAYVDFRDLLVPLDDDAFDEVVEGEWAARHVLAHMSGWFRELAPIFGRIQRGEPLPAPTNYDHTWNARFAAAALEGQAALDDFDDAFHQFYAAAKALDEPLFEVGPDGGASPAIALLRGMGAEHFAEHRGPLETWLARREALA